MTKASSHNIDGIGYSFGGSTAHTYNVAIRRFGYNFTLGRDYNIGVSFNNIGGDWSDITVQNLLMIIEVG